MVTSPPIVFEVGCRIVACETQHTCAKGLGSLAVTILLRASHSFNLALHIAKQKLSSKVYSTLMKTETNELRCANAGND